MAQVTCFLFFVITFNILLGCNCKFRQFERSVYRPYGPKMCRELCSYSADSFLYLVQDFTCYRIQLHEYRSRGNRTQGTLPTCPKNSKMVINRTTLVEWDICNKEYKDKAMDHSGKTKDYICSRHLQLVQDIRDRTLLQASGEGELPVVSYVLSSGIADIDCRGQFGRTPVMAAAENSQIIVFDFQVSNGCNLSLIDDNKNNVLHIACMGGSTDIVTKLLNHACCDIESREEYQRTPMLVATIHCNIGVLQYLVSRDCNLSAVDEYGGNMLHAACLCANIDIVNYILNLGIFDKDSSNHFNRTPVMVAARHGNNKLVELLVSIDCKVTLEDTFGDNILHIACLSDDVGLVDYILAKGIADIDSRSGTLDQTPVMIAAWNGHKDIVVLLVNRGCNLTAVDRDGNNILSLASLKGHVDVEKYIIRRGILAIDNKSNDKKKIHQ